MTFNCGNLVTGVSLFLTGSQKQGILSLIDGDEFKTVSYGYVFMAWA